MDTENQRIPPSGFGSAIPNPANFRQHQFIIATGFQNTTVMYCQSCGLSYRLVAYTGTTKSPSRSAWEVMNFETPQGEIVPGPGLCK